MLFFQRVFCLLAVCVVKNMDGVSCVSSLKEREKEKRRERNRRYYLKRKSRATSTIGLDSVGTPILPEGETSAGGTGAVTAGVMCKNICVPIGKCRQLTEDQKERKRQRERERYHRKKAKIVSNLASDTAGQISEQRIDAKPEITVENLTELPNHYVGTNLSTNNKENNVRKQSKTKSLQNHCVRSKTTTPMVDPHIAPVVGDSSMVATAVLGEGDHGVFFGSRHHFILALSVKALRR